MVFERVCEMLGRFVGLVAGLVVGLFDGLRGKALVGLVAVRGLSGVEEPCGTGCSGRRALRRLENCVAGLLSVELKQSSGCSFGTSPASLSPRRCLFNNGGRSNEALLENVLDRLGTPRLESVEEAVEAVDVWRRGDGDAVGLPSRVRGA
jgi:hypothetical protein